MTTEAEGQCQRDSEGVSLLTVRIEEGPCAKECRQPLVVDSGRRLRASKERGYPVLQLQQSKFGQPQA